MSETEILAVIGKPLRKITGVIRHADSIYGSQFVALECGHEVSASSRAWGKARCGRCQKELRASLAALLEKGTRVQQTRDAYRAAGSGPHRNRMAEHVEAVDDFCATLAHVSGKGRETAHA